jgi:hypothetical protein
MEVYSYAVGKVKIYVFTSLHFTSTRPIGVFTVTLSLFSLL